MFLHALLRDKSAQDSQAIKVIFSLDKAKKILEKLHIQILEFLFPPVLLGYQLLEVLAMCQQICGYWILAESISDPKDQGVMKY